MSEHKTHVSAHLEIDLTCNQEKENNHQLLSRKVMFFIFFLWDFFAALGVDGCVVRLARRLVCRDWDICSFIYEAAKEVADKISSRRGSSGRIKSARICPPLQRRRSTTKMENT